MTTANFNGGKVQVYDDNLTDISENLFWFREVSDQHAATQTALLQDILTVLRQIHEDLQNHNQPAPQPVSLYQADTKVIQLDGVRPIDAAIAWLRENDPELKLTAREAAVRASMSQATINRAQQKLRGK